MKKTYIIPNSTVTVLNSCEYLLQASAHAVIGSDGITYGGKSEGGMSSDVKTSSYSVWDDDWSE